MNQTHFAYDKSGPSEALALEPMGISRVAVTRRKAPSNTFFCSASSLMWTRGGRWQHQQLVIRDMQAPLVTPLCCHLGGSCSCPRPSPSPYTIPPPQIELSE
jgi:hypothetical protein